MAGPVMNVNYVTGQVNDVISNVKAGFSDCVVITHDFALLSRHPPRGLHAASLLDGEGQNCRFVILAGSGWRPSPPPRQGEQPDATGSEEGEGGGFGNHADRARRIEVARVPTQAVVQGWQSNLTERPRKLSVE